MKTCSCSVARVRNGKWYFNVETLVCACLLEGAIMTRMEAVGALR